jgi:hypothetical protein
LDSAYSNPADHHHSLPSLFSYGAEEVAPAFEFALPAEVDELVTVDVPLPPLIVEEVMFLAGLIKADPATCPPALMTADVAPMTV